MKSYGQIIYEATAKVRNLKKGWMDLDRAEQVEYDRIGEEAAQNIYIPPWRRTVDRNKGTGE